MQEAARVEIAHGGGGRKTQQLIKTVFQKHFTNNVLDQMLDAAIFDMAGNKLAFSTDSFVINPIFFPGGDIGKLAVYGTVNDIAVSGAKPYYMSTGIIIEEGFLLEHLQRISASMALAAQDAGVQIVAGDTKVVEKGAVDKIFINTSALGIVQDGVNLHPAKIKPGDAIIVNGSLGEHGLVIEAGRRTFTLATPVQSDCANLLPVAQAMLRFGDKLRCMRDATRGGLATTLNELALQSGLTFEIEQERLPVSPTVAGACKLLGLDPLYLANEGKLVAIVAQDCVDALISAMQSAKGGENTCVVGRVTRDLPGMVALKTLFGAWRVLPMLEGEMLPRLC